MIVQAGRQRAKSFELEVYKTKKTEFEKRLEKIRKLHKKNASREHEKVNRKTNETTTPLLKIGARNPYAMIAEYEMKQQLSKGCKTKGSIISSQSPAIEMKSPPCISKEQVAKILGIPVKLKGDDIPFDKLTYNQLFDPAYRSRLFCYRSSRLVKTKAIPPGSPADCENSIIDWAPPKDATGNDIPPVSPGAHFCVLDPVQGSAPDCWFVAALSSIAWQDSTPLETCKPGSDEQLYFYDENATYGNDFLEQPLWQDLPLKAPNDPAGAKSGGNYVETYPAQYELGMAKFTNTALYPQREDPNICSMPPGDPQWALMAITLTDPWIAPIRVNLNIEHSLDDKIARFENEVTNPAAYRLFEAANLNHAGFSHQTQYPAVAWTYCSGDPEITQLNPPEGFCLPNQIAPRNSGVKYDNEILVANHSYSLLGICTDNDVKYVVVRNPYGLNSEIPTTLNVTLLSTSLQLDPEDAPGTVVPICPPKASGAGTTIYKGVFALKLSDFANYFSGFGWVIL